MSIKTEIWGGHEIRFVEKESEWWAVAVDVTKALDIANTTQALKRIPPKNQAIHTLYTNEGSNSGINQEVNLISEFGIYELVFTSRKPEAEAFKQWMFEVIKKLRQTTGLEGFQVFRMMDKEHQKEAMKFLDEGLDKANDIDYYKANSVANKATSNYYGKPKQVKKNDMPPEWLEKRQQILEDVVELMVANRKFGLGVSISKTIYGKHMARTGTASAPS